MATVAEQRQKLTLNRSQAASNTKNISSTNAVANTARTLATGKANKNISADRKIAGEVLARTGQAVGAYFGGVGAPIGKRIGRVAGENWRLVAIILVLLILFIVAQSMAMLLLILTPILQLIP